MKTSVVTHNKAQKALNQSPEFVFGKNPARVFTGSGLITGSDRIGPKIGYLAHF